MTKINKIQIYILLFFVAFNLFGTVVFGQDGGVLAKVDQACAVFGSYKAGINGESITAMEYAVLSMPLDSPDRLTVEQKLIDAFGTATLDGQRTIGRILHPIATEATVKGLAVYKDSKANDGQTALIAKALIEFIQRDKPVVYPENKTFVCPYKPGEFYRDDFKVESDSALVKRIREQINALTTIADPVKRKAAMEPLGILIERSPNPLEFYSALFSALPDETSGKQIFDLMGRSSRRLTVFNSAVEKMRKKDALQANAALAAVRIANKLRVNWEDECRRALREIYETVENADVKKRAAAVLQQMDIDKGMIFYWLAAENSDGTAWQPLLTGKTRRGWDLAVALTPEKNSTIIMKTVVPSSEPRTLQCNLEACSQVRVLYEGKTIYTCNDKTVPTRLHKFPIQLKPTNNEIRVIIDYPGGSCPLTLRFCDDEGFVVNVQ